MDDWRLSSATQQSITPRQIAIVFEHLLAAETASNQYILMRRAFVNAPGKLYLADSEEEDAAIKMRNSLLPEFKAHIAGVSNQERHDWEWICYQIWQENSRKETTDVDRIRSGRKRNKLRRQIKEIFTL